MRKEKAECLAQIRLVGFDSPGCEPWVNNDATPPHKALKERNLNSHCTPLQGSFRILHLLPRAHTLGYKKAFSLKRNIVCRLHICSICVIYNT